MVQLEEVARRTKKKTPKRQFDPILQIYRLHNPPNPRTCAPEPPTLPKKRKKRPQQTSSDHHSDHNPPKKTQKNKQ